METLKVKIKKIITPEIPAVTEEKEIEISFPFYSKSDENFYKLLNENAGICVHLTPTSQRIQYQRYSIIRPYNEAFSGQISDEQEFNTAYNKAMDMIQASIPTREEVESTNN